MTEQGLLPRRDPPPSGAWLVIVWVLLALGIAATRFYEHREAGLAEQARLTLQARAVDENLSRQIQGADRALLSVRADLAGWRGDALAARAEPRLRALSDALPGVRTMVIVDAAGRVAATNRRELLGRDVSEREFFREATARPDASVLFVSPPYVGALGVTTLNVGRVVTDTDGRFAGLVLATLDPEYFEVALRSAIYAPDMWTAVAHVDGSVLTTAPAIERLAGAKLAKPGSLFSRHLASGRIETVFVDTVMATGDLRMMVQRSILPASVPMDRPLVLALSRDVTAIYAPWRHETAVYIGFYLLFCAVSGAAWVMLRQRERALEALAAARDGQQRADAERLATALRGADLGLWDLHVPSGRAIVSERWREMIGLGANDDVDTDAWARLVHPDDRAQVLATQQAHLDGRSEGYEALYRMRHADGRWVWILDRGRVIERDAAGAPLRMVGTHKDFTARVEASEALRRSEQSLAATLNSIGDAVIATDDQGRIERLNPAAEQLTGWRAGEAMGRPIGEVFRLFDTASRQPLDDPLARASGLAAGAARADDALLVARDGAERLVAHNVAPIRAAGGEVAGIVLVFSDVTERHRAEQALRERERQLSAITAALPGPVSRVDRDGRYLFANAAYERWFGVSPGDMIGRTQREVLGAIYPRVEPYFRRALAGEQVQYEAPVTQARGGPLYGLVTLVPDVAADGSVCGHFTVVTDITERKRAEVALRQGEQKSRALLDALRAGVVAHGADTQVLDSNPSASRLLGLSPEQMRGKVAIDPAWSFLEEDGSTMPLARYPVNQVLASGQPLKNFVLGIRRPDLDHPLWVLVDASPVLDAAGQIEQVIVTFADITERKQAAEQLRLLEASVARLNDIVLITEVDEARPQDSRIVFVNDAFQRLTGYTRDEVIGRSPRLLQGPSTDPAEIRRIADALRQRLPVRAELLNYTKDGAEYWIEIDIVPVSDSSGRVTHMVAVERDVTERRRTQQRMQAAQDELEATLSAVPDLLFDIDLDGRVHGYHSPRSDLLYVPPAQFVGRCVAEFLPAEAATVVMLALQQAQQQGHSTGRQYSLPLEGGTRWFELSVARKPVAEGERPRCIALARDVTDRKQAESERLALHDRLREAQKMESIGTLAGGIAHDFNNILAGILGNVALAREDLPPGHAALASLDQVQKAGLRARSLVQQILAFSRRQPQALQRLALRPVIEETVGLLRATLPAGVRLETRLAKPPIEIEADATQMQQVLMNLCTNAWHALPVHGGRIEVGLELVEVDPGATPALAELPAGPAAHLWVRDNGSGMDAPTLSRIFDPFFTTKPTGQGTGLGLSVVHGIVRAHRGAISVESRPGEGSSFHLHFPLARAAGHAEEAGEASAAAARRGRGQRVLYIDDDDVMVLMVERLLQRAGFRTAARGDALEALALLQLDPQAFDVVVTDYNMPEMSGLDVARAVRRLRPDLPVLVSSGHLPDSLLAEAAQAGVRASMRKENTFEELAGLISEVLDTPGP